MNAIKAVMGGKLSRLRHTYRYSAIPIVNRENVAEHSIWTALIGVTIAMEVGGGADLIGEEASKALVHYIDESMTGDLIRDMKYHDPAVRESIRKVEVEFADGIFNELGGTTGHTFGMFWRMAKDDSESGHIVALADLLCVIAYCDHEQALGNNTAEVRQIRADCTRLIHHKFDGTELGDLAAEAIR